MRDLGPTILIRDREIEQLAMEHYGIEGYNPSEYGLIGGDDSDGYVLVNATDEALTQYAFWQSQIQQWIDGTAEPTHMMHGLIHRFVLDGHLPRSMYVVHGVWG